MKLAILEGNSSNLLLCVHGPSTAEQLEQKLEETSRKKRNELEVGEDNSLSLFLSFTWNNGWCLAFNPRTLVTRRRSWNDNQSRTGSPFAIFLPFVPPLRLIISPSHGIFETFTLCSWQSVLSACLLIDRPSLSVLLSANSDPWPIFIAFFILKNKLKVREVIDENSFEFFGINRKG